MAGQPSGDERFLSRWSRLKRAQGQGTAPGTTPQPATIAPPNTATVTAVPGNPATVATDPQPLLPSIESLTMDSDYAQFFQPKVPESLRRAAVKKLFADPHFNIMDGLDTYIDDYTKFEPIPEAMLRTLVQARDIIDHPSNRPPPATTATPADLPQTLAATDQPGKLPPDGPVPPSVDPPVGPGERPSIDPPDEPSIEPPVGPSIDRPDGPTTEPPIVPFIDPPSVDARSAGNDAHFALQREPVPATASSTAVDHAFPSSSTPRLEVNAAKDTRPS